jgi:CelD/BcsL family acetyltransferase involved in cellulose biosynthesis
MSAATSITNAAPEAAALSGPLRSVWLSATDEFASLRSEWAELFEAAACESVFLSFEWMFTWWKHWGPDRRLAIVAVRDDCGTLVALAPFSIARSRPSGMRRLSFLADDHVGSDYLGILARPGWEKAAVEAIASALLFHRRDWDYIELGDAEDSSLLASLCARLETAGMTATKTHASTCHFIPLPSSFDGYLAGIGIKLRANYRRRWRILERTGPAEFIAVSDPAGLERHFPELVRLHRIRFERRQQESAFVRPGVPAFHEEALKALAARGWARLYLLRANGQVVAALYGFSMGSAFQFYQCGMDPEWMKVSVGQILVGRSIDEAIRTGHSDFDFLRGDESYKAQWTERTRETVTVRLFDYRPASLAARAAYVAAAALRRVKRWVKAARAKPAPDAQENG